MSTLISQVFAKASLREKHIDVKSSLCVAPLQLLFDMLSDSFIMCFKAILILEALVNSYCVPLRGQPLWIEFRMRPNKQGHTSSYAALEGCNSIILFCVDSQDLEGLCLGAELTMHACAAVSERLKAWPPIAVVSALNPMPCVHPHAVQSSCTCRSAHSILHHANTTCSISDLQSVKVTPTQAGKIGIVVVQEMCVLNGGHRLL